MGEGDAYKPWDPSFTHWIRFRNPHSLGPVVVQSFMILCAMLVILGLIYVLCLVIAIAIHHVCFDRDPKKVPDYVKQSVQFSSESEGEETDDPDANDRDNDDEASRQTSDEKGNQYSNQAKKTANLDKFMREGGAS